MTRKDYIVVATMLHEMRPLKPTQIEAAAAVLQRSYSNFNRDRFIEYVDKLRKQGV